MQRDVLISTITARYSGDANFAPNTSAVLLQGVSLNAIFVTGADAGGGPNVLVFDSVSGAVKFNFFAYAELPGGLQGNARIQARSAQPITSSPRVLDNVVYFPANAAPTPQTFTDLDGNSTLDVIFYPDGRVSLPSGVTVGTITIKTDMKIPRSQYTITISPSGRVLAQ